VGLRFSTPIFKEMLRYGLPLIPEGVGYFILNFADRFILQRFTNLSEVGLYSLGYKFGMIISPMITEPFLSIWRPKMFETAHNKNAKDLYSVMFTYFMFVEIFAGLFISILIIDALKIISSPEYYGCYKIVPLIAFSYILSAGYSFVQMGLLQRKKTKHVAYIVLVAAGLNMGLNLLLIPRLGMWGAAISTILSFLVLFIFNYAVSNKIYYIRYQYLRLAKMLVLAVLLYFLAAAIKIDSFILSISTRTVIALSFPLLLYVLRFYTAEEIQKFKNIITRVLGSLKAKEEAK
jgi:O-antigen/teichoic acid export membrane protein